MFVIDSNAPYFTDFPLSSAADAVYMTASDAALGDVFAVVYRSKPGAPKLSVILIGAHGTSGFVDMTLSSSSRYFGACRGLAPSHYLSPVRRALAIAVLRTFATTDAPLRDRLGGNFDESAAGALGSRFRLVHGKFPEQMGTRLVEAGLISPKNVRTALLDIVYEDSDLTIDQNNELVYLLGEQLEQLFDPLSEYSPQSMGKPYEPEKKDGSLDTESKPVQDLCEQIYLAESRFRTEILDLLESTLVPLRLEVLKGSFPNLSIVRLNTVFPPTIDELARINNFFYQALREAVPLGAYEVVRACGLCIPYFFRACMRHQAATASFGVLLDELLQDEPEVAEMLHASREDIAKVVLNSANCLGVIRRCLEDLAKKEHQWDPQMRDVVDEYISVATTTIDALGIDSSNSESVTGADALRSLSLNWPPELDEGSHRVITSFEAVDILETDERTRKQHVVFVVFGDVLVVCRPTAPVYSVSPSGLPLPSVADLLQHAMLNGTVEQVRKYMPMLEIVAFEPILRSHFATFDKSQHLFVITPSLVGSFWLLQPDMDAENLVSLLAKAKITTKTTPFHLFRIDAGQTTDCTTLYSTVQEMRGYALEKNKTKVALFLSMSINERTLAKYNLAGAIGIEQLPDSVVHVRIVSKLGYNAEFTVSKNQFELQKTIVGEVTYLQTLSLSSQNAEMLDSIIDGNKMIATRMIEWASHRVHVTHAKGDREAGGATTSGTATASGPTTTNGPTTSGTAAKESDKDAVDKGSRDVSHSSGGPHGRAPFVIASRSLESLRPVIPEAEGGTSTPKKTVKRTNNFEFEPSSPTSSNMPLDLSSVDEIVSNIDYTSASEYSSEESEQRDVDNWYHQLRSRQTDDQSLSSSGLSDSDAGYTSSFMNVNEPIQIGGTLNRSASMLYNRNAGRAFPRIQSSIMEAEPSHQRTLTESSFETIASLAPSSTGADDSYMSQQVTDDEDFAYLAALVNSASLSKLSEIERSGTYPSLRDTSLVKLGSYVVRSDKMSRTPTFDAIKEEDPEATPRLGGTSPKSDQDVTLTRDSTEDTVDTVETMLPTSNAAGRPVSTIKTVESTSTVDAELEEVPQNSPESKNNLPPPVKFQPFADIENNNWLPSPIYSSYKEHDPFSPKYNFIYQMEDGQFGDRGSYELAENWLAWSQAQGSPQHGTPISSPQRGSPQRDSPQRNSPQRDSPLRSTPLRGSPLRGSEQSSPQRSSPQRLARLDTLQFSTPRAVPQQRAMPGSTPRATPRATTHRDSFSEYSLKGASFFGSPVNWSPVRDFSLGNSPLQMSPDSHRRSVGAQTPNDMFGQRGLQSSDSRQFRQMVMSSSLHTLQLASFVNLIDRKAIQTDEEGMLELQHVKHYVVRIYKNRYPSPEFEQTARRQLCGCYMLLMRLQFEQLANALLEIEWVRRTRVVEVLGTSADLWKF